MPIKLPQPVKPNFHVVISCQVSLDYPSASRVRISFTAPPHPDVLLELHVFQLDPKNGYSIAYAKAGEYYEIKYPSNVKSEELADAIADCFEHRHRLKVWRKYGDYLQDEISANSYRVERC